MSGEGGSGPAARSFTEPTVRRGHSDSSPSSEAYVEDTPSEPGSRLVRSYTLTGGRTRSSGVDLAIETLVATTARARREPHLVQFERGHIAQLADTPLSVAEVAAHVGIPLGVARVLVSDMTSEGLLEIYKAPELVTEVSIIERLIAGVKAL